MAANADVAATDEVQLVPCEQTIHVATFGRNRKHLSCVLALRTDLGAGSPNPRSHFHSPCWHQHLTKINPRCARSRLAHMFHDERQHTRHTWAAASMTTKGSLSKSQWESRASPCNRIGGHAQESEIHSEVRQSVALITRTNEDMSAQDAEAYHCVES